MLQSGRKWLSNVPLNTLASIKKNPPALRLSPPHPPPMTRTLPKSASSHCGIPHGNSAPTRPPLNHLQISPHPDPSTFPKPTFLPPQSTVRLACRNGNSTPATRSLFRVSGKAFPTAGVRQHGIRSSQPRLANVAAHQTMRLSKHIMLFWSMEVLMMYRSI